MQERSVDIAIVGAAGLVAEALLAAIDAHPRLSGSVVLLGGPDEVGRGIEFGSRELEIADLELHSFDATPIVISTGESDVAPDWVERAQDARCIVLDIGSHLCPESDLVPVVGAVNPEALEPVLSGGVVPLPGSVATQLLTVIKPLIETLGVERVSLFVAQAVSELGRSGVEEVVRQTSLLLNGKPVAPLLFPRQIAFNLIPQVGECLSGGMSKMEADLLDVCQLVLGRSCPSISVSSAWVPVFFGHSMALHCTASQPVAQQVIESCLEQADGIELIDVDSQGPSPVGDASGGASVLVGRFVCRTENPTEFSLWAVADNLRSGIAANVLKILEILVKGHL